MAKGYDSTDQAFGAGDIALYNNHPVKILECIEDDDGWWYLIQGEYTTSKEVPQSALEQI